MAVRDEFPCPGCQVRLTKRSLEPYQETVHDPLLGRTIQRVKRVPVFLKYLIGTRHLTKHPDADDLALLGSVDLASDPSVREPFALSAGGLSEGNASLGHDAPAPLLHAPQLPDALPDDRRRRWPAIVGN